MATGRMEQGLATRTAPHFILAAAACLLPPGVPAAEVGLAGVTASKAMLMIDGAPPQAVGVGQSLEGIRVLSIQGDQVIIEVDGRKRPLRIGQHAVGSPSPDSGGKAVLTANGLGHFLTTGAINGKSVQFLVDTGASMISIGSGDARRLGLDAAQGEIGVAQTASGPASASKVKLDTVRVGDITLHNVDALILKNDMPIALLGMSFLNRMDMQRDGNTMTLKKRY